MARPRNNKNKNKTGIAPKVGSVGLAAALLTGSMIASPQTAFAAAAFPASNMYATQSGSSDIVAIDRSTGVATTVLTAPNGATGLNQIGISGDGNKMILTNGSNVYEYTAATETWETTPRAGIAPKTMGGVDPVSGLYYFGGQSDGSNFTFTTYDPTTNVVSGRTVTVTAADAPGGNGDLAFDSLGNLYFVSSGDQFAQAYRVDAASLGSGTATAVKVGPTIDAGLALNSMAFADDGYLYISGSGANGFLRVNPVTGDVLERRSLAAPITDLGSNAFPYTASVAVKLPGGRAQPGDQFTVTIAGGGISTGNTNTTTGTNNSGTVGPLLILPNETYTITQTPAGTTDPANYTTTWQCIDAVSGTVLAAGQGSSGEFALPATSRNAACLFTTTPVVAVDDSSLDNTPGTTVTVGVTDNDKGDLDPKSVRIIDGTNTPVTELVVPGQGTWTTNPTTGVISFTPETGYTGNPTPITYQVTDTLGKTVNAKVTITYTPVAVDDSSLDNTPGTTVNVGVTDNDKGDLDPKSVRIIDGTNTPVTELVVPGQGTWTTNPTTGVISFTPETGYTGNPTPITYQVTDTLGKTVNAKVTITYTPVVVPPVDAGQSTGDVPVSNPPKPAPDQELAFTGANIAGLGAFGLGIVVLGGVLIFRRRQHG